jgi:hypothetical protein
MRDTSVCNFQKLPRVYNHPMGENSPNLVTLQRRKSGSDYFECMYVRGSVVPFPAVFLLQDDSDEQTYYLYIPVIISLPPLTLKHIPVWDSNPQFSDRVMCP